MQTNYSIQVLGGLSISDSHGHLIELSSRKAEAIVVYLLFSEKTSCEREELATLLWEEMPETKALTNLRVTLSNIKKQCPDLLMISRRRVAINPHITIDADYVNLERVIDAVVGGELNKKELSLEQAKALSAALPLYRGDFLQGFFIRNAIAFEDWAAFKRESLRRGLIDASQMLIHTYQSNQMLGEGIETASRLLFIDPFNDAAYNWLIELYALNGQREKSLETYAAYEKMLVDEIGIELSNETRMLVDSIRDGTITTASPQSEAVEKTGLPVPNNIPIELSPFFGRGAELAQLRGYLQNPHLRLVTMIGQGGTGKTRLAIEAARHNLRLFQDGVWFVGLESVVSADLVLPEIYKVLGIAYPHRDQAQQELIRYMNGHHILIVLDNFEHLLNASAIISEIIQHTENSKIIVTSREMTGLPEETNMILEGLASRPEGETKAVGTPTLLSSAGKMFIERASRMHSGFDPVAKDYPLIEDICDLVARLPLGIELAASGLKQLTLKALHDRIADDISFLRSDRPDLPERQRSLLSVFNTFWDQLAEDEQSLISRLSVFCGVVTQEAAKQVAGVSVFFISNLVSRGFLKRVGSYGYRAHSMHRHYVREKLKEDPEQFQKTSTKHRDYYFDMLQRITRPLRDSPQKVMLDELEGEMCNIRASLYFTISTGEKQKALALCELLMPFWKIRGYYQEGYHWLDQVFELEGDANSVMESSALCAAAKLVSVLGDHAAAEAYSQRSLKIATETGDQHGVARALNSLGAALAEKGNPKQAEQIYSESLEIYRNLRVQQAIAGTLVNLANMEIENGDTDHASAMLEEAMTSFRLVGDSVGITHVLIASARIALMRADSVSARTILREALEKAWNLSAREELIRVYLLLANAFALDKSWTMSTQFLALVMQAVQRHKLPLPASEKQIEEELTELTMNALGEKAFNTAWRKGNLTGEAAMVKHLLHSDQ